MYKYFIEKITGHLDAGDTPLCSAEAEASAVLETRLLFVILSFFIKEILFLIANPILHQNH